MRRPLVTILTLFLLGAGSLAAQDEGLPPSDVFVDTVDVNVVNVEVFVTDKKGNRVTGLKKKDFELYSEKKPIAITNFYAVEGGLARTAAGEKISEEPDLDPRLRADPRRRRVPEEQRLHLVIYVDNLNLRPFNRNRALRYVRSFLRNRLRPGDEVMLVTYERALHVRHQFTSDPEIISSALYEVEEMSGMGVHADSDRRDILRDVYEADSMGLVRGRATQYAESLYSDLRFTLDALKELVDTLAGLPGRKAVLYVSDGLPMRAGEDVFHALDDRFRSSSADNFLMDGLRFDLSRDFQELTARANTHRVTFYTLDAAGLRTYSYMDASNSSIGGGSRIDQIHFTNIQSTLRLLAQETGGMVLLNTNNYGPLLDRVAEDFDTYYSLGFQPASAESGRYHRLEVQVKGRKGLVVRFRDGYRDKPVSTRMSEGTLAALHYGYQSNPLGVEIEVGEERDHSSGRFLVPVTVRIPIGKLSFLPQAEAQRGRLRLFVGAKDAEGGLAPIQDIPVPIDIPQADFERARAQFYEYSMTLMMRQGRQVVAVGVRDEIGAVNAFATRGVSIGGPRRGP